ncbi:FAD-dependent oxidoreductase [Nannocystis pusilla]|uniref:FAD-dependent oxidoreductase n=1 Tax=Nannocystis pusilla TaxID=889268 RepID=UPI003B77F4B0
MTNSATTRRPRVLVVGLGISGIATALRLHRLGWEPVIIERAPDGAAAATRWPCSARAWRPRPGSACSRRWAIAWARRSRRSRSIAAVANARAWACPTCPAGRGWCCAATWRTRSTRRCRRTSRSASRPAPWRSPRTIAAST